jgi:hypothetical protein
VEEIASLKLKIFDRSFGLLVPQAEELIDADDGVSCYEAHTVSYRCLHKVESQLMFNNYLLLCSTFPSKSPALPSPLPSPNTRSST